MTWSVKSTILVLIVSALLLHGQVIYGGAKSNSQNNYQSTITNDTRWNTIDIRNSSGELEQVKTRHGNTVEIRDSNGEYIGEEYYDE
jgi:hypothetical protein